VLEAGGPTNNFNDDSIWALSSSPPFKTVPFDPDESSARAEKFAKHANRENSATKTNLRGHPALLRNCIQTPRFVRHLQLYQSIGGNLWRSGETGVTGAFLPFRCSIFVGRAWRCHAPTIVSYRDITPLAIACAVPKFLIAIITVRSNVGTGSITPGTAGILARTDEIGLLPLPKGDVV